MTNDPQPFFERYERHYTEGATSYFRSAEEVRALRLARLPAAIENLPRAARILDAGCATGYTLYLLQEKGFSNLVGVDISKELLGHAHEILPDGVQLVHSEIAEFLQTCSDASFDAIIFHHVIEHIDRAEIAGLLSQFHRCLAPGGLLDIKTPNADCILAGHHVYGDITHLVALNQQSLLQVLEAAGFDPHKVAFPTNAPKLFFSIQHPVRMMMRFVNRLRWYLNRCLHFAVFMLADIHPRPRTVDRELEAVAHR